MEQINEYRSKSKRKWEDLNTTQCNDTTTILMNHEDENEAELTDEEFARLLQQEENNLHYIIMDRDEQTAQDMKLNIDIDIDDPNPDIRALFIHFNKTLFDGLLAAVPIEWSNKMTLCAGLCKYEGKGGLCSIKLSSCLLKYRPKIDTIQTLLHEMIHAFLFVTERDTDRDGHGPKFQAHMKRVNGKLGCNITIYHTFLDEVDHYRQHWWKCTGTCQNKPPYFGYVKRAMNRAPGEKDPWFKNHELECGGTFIKIKEPENYGNTKKKQKIHDEHESNKKIIDFFKKIPAEQKDINIVDKNPIKNNDIQNKTTTVINSKVNSPNKSSQTNPWILASAHPNKKEDIKQIECPVCSKKISESIINNHLDSCLASTT